MIEKLLKQGVMVIHALKGYEYHEKRIIELFDQMGMSYEFVTNGDPIHFRQEVLEKYFVPINGIPFDVLIWKNRTPLL